MKILAIETSTSSGSVAIAEDGELHGERSFQSRRSHNSQIFAPLGEILEDDLDGIVVGTGPGSYTGVRIGIAAGMGLALARGIPLMGIPSTQAIDCEDSTYAVVGDARRGDFFWSVGDAIEVLALEKLGFRALEWEKPIFTFDAKPPVAAAVVTSPRAAVLARSASVLDERKLNELAASPVEPIYLRPAFVTTPRKPGKGVPK